VPVSPRTVAVLVANPALSSILEMVLAANPSLRVRAFDSLLALSTYMQLAPVDMIVAELDGDGTRADLVAQALRSDRRLDNPHFQIIALARTVDKDRWEAARRAGIEEVLVKPMSPRYLLERVLARLRMSPLRPLARHRVRPPAADNVVPLFGPRDHPLH
jgi:two-component system phosphate regulon response regulator PhoB